MTTITNSTTEPATEETPCTWCGGDKCKSVMQPAFCTDCTLAMLRDEAETRRDLYRAPAAPELAPELAPEPAPEPPARYAKSIAHFPNLELHGLVIITQPNPIGERRVYYGTPENCAPVCNVTGRKVFTNAISGVRYGGLRRLIAHAEKVGPRELAWYREMASAKGGR